MQSTLGDLSDVSTPSLVGTLDHRAELIGKGRVAGAAPKEFRFFELCEGQRADEKSTGVSISDAWQA